MLPFSFFAFLAFGLYHIYVTNPQAFMHIKMTIVFGLLQFQMFFENLLNEGKQFYNKYNRYVLTHLVNRKKMFKNNNIIECTAHVYNLDRTTHQKIKFDGIAETLITPPNTIVIITEIKFDNLKSVRLTHNSNEQYSFKKVQDLIDNNYARGYPAQLPFPFMCVVVVYDDNKYEVTKFLSEYMHSKNEILSLNFVKMIMFEHLGVVIKNNSPVYLDMVDKDLNIKYVELDQQEPLFKL